MPIVIFTISRVGIKKPFVTGGDGEGPWFIPDILVNVHGTTDEPTVGIIREVLQVCLSKAIWEKFSFASLC